MAKTLAKSKKPAAKAKGVATAKGAKKPAKAVKGASKPKASSAKFKEGDEVIFNGYSKETENPVFEAEDRLTVVKAETDKEKNVVLSCVKSEDYEDYQEDEDSVTGDQVYASEVKKAPKEAVDPYKELAAALTEDEKLTSFINEEGDGDALAAGVAAQEAVAQNMFMLGGCLATLYADQKFREYGKKGEFDDDRNDDDKVIPNSGWDKFTDAHFDMNGRKALSFISTYKAFNGLQGKVDLEEIASNRKIGWVKLGAMASVVTEDNVEDLVAQAEDLNVSDFKQMLKTDHAKGAGESSGGSKGVKRTTIKAVLYEDAGAHVHAILDEVMKQLSTDDIGTALEFIIVDWAHNSLSETQNKRTTKARKDALKAAKKAGADISARETAFNELSAQLEGGDEEDEEDGEE